MPDDATQGETTLLPCPHCGAAARVSWTLAGGCYIGCGVDGCCGEGGDHGHLYFTTEAEAIAAWNRRSGSPHSTVSEEVRARLELYAVTGATHQWSGPEDADIGQGIRADIMALLRGSGSFPVEPEKGADR